MPLDIDGEAVFELEPLAVADAVELFIRRASHRKRQAYGDVGEAVHDLCRSLDGLPLAIELAAARTKTLSIAEISRRLDGGFDDPLDGRFDGRFDRRFDVLSDPTSRRPERRRALKATIRWSYELLFPDDQRGLWALATFAGGATLPAVEHVLEALEVPARTTIDVVGRLASRSLVIVDDDGASAQLRYRLLDSIRAFALEAMTEAGLTESAHAAHARWFAENARRSTDGVRSDTAGRAPCASPGASGRTSMQHSTGAPPTTLCSQCPSSTDSGGPGSSSATVVARSESWSRSMPPVMLLHLRTERPACCSRHGSRHRSAISSSPAPILTRRCPRRRDR